MQQFITQQWFFFVDLFIFIYIGKNNWMGRLTITSTLTSNQPVLRMHWTTDEIPLLESLIRS